MLSWRGMSRCRMGPADRVCRRRIGATNRIGWCRMLSWRGMSRCRMLGRSWVTSDRVGSHRVGRRGFGATDGIRRDRLWCRFRGGSGIGAAHGVPHGVHRDRLRSGGRLLDRLLGGSVRGEWLGRLPSDGCGLVLDGRGLLLHRRRRLLLDRGRLLLDRGEASIAAATGRVKRATSATASRWIGSRCGLRGATAAATGWVLCATSAASAAATGRVLCAAASRRIGSGCGLRGATSATSATPTSPGWVLCAAASAASAAEHILGSSFCAKEEAEGEYRDERRSQHQHELAARRDRPRAATATRVGKVVVAVFAQLYAASAPSPPDRWLC
jgi:hypothetical protein